MSRLQIRPQTPGYGVHAKVTPFACPLQSLIIQREALDKVFAQPLSCPDTELRATMGLHPVSNGDIGVEVVVFKIS